MLVVSDTSPISALLSIGREQLLPDLFQSVCIPVAVRDELARFHVAIPAFLQVRSISDRAAVDSFRGRLDLGESEAIVLARECQADYLLVDERRGRKIAKEEGLQVIGLLGALLLARKRSLLPSLKDCIKELTATAGFYVDDATVAAVLKAAGE
jgi:predicted nucleic acid-binding protein